jgi:hypothetical protein
LLALREVDDGEAAVAEDSDWSAVEQPSCIGTSMAELLRHPFHLEAGILGESRVG